jgi:hypothetical protein
VRVIESGSEECAVVPFDMNNITGLRSAVDGLYLVAEYPEVTPFDAVMFFWFKTYR